MSAFVVDLEPGRRVYGTAGLDEGTVPALTEWPLRDAGMALCKTFC
jgi:hypothetical protein